MYTNIKQIHYKSQSARIDGMDSKGWWFQGAGSFIRNGYVIYTNGLDGYPPNPIALGHGNELQSRLVDPSLANNSIFMRFINQLLKVADAQAENEDKYISFKLEQLKQNSDVDVNYLNAITRALELRNYSSAYTLLLRRDQDLAKFREEIHKPQFHLFQKTSEFFNKELRSYVESQIKVKEGAYKKTGEPMLVVSLNTTFDKIVNDYFDDIIQASADNVGINQLKQKMIELYQQNNQTNVIQIDNKYLAQTIKKGKTKTRQVKESQKNKLVKKSQVITKDEKFRSPAVIAEAFAKEIIGQIGRGLTQEAYTVGTFEHLGAKAFMTGRRNTMRTTYFGDSYARAGKNDIVAYDVYSATLNLDDIIAEMANEGITEIDDNFHEELAKRLQERAKIETGEIFEIATNVKGYFSVHDLNIEETGTFNQRMGTLKRMNLDGGMVDKLIFMLNNTTKGCIAENNQGEIADYIAAVCVAWMWDNSEDIFEVNVENLPKNYHKVYLFNSGSAFFTASEIIRSTANHLVTYLDASDPHQFVDVTINPPKAYGGYSGLIKQYPMEGITSKDAWQATLKQMWDEVKADAMNSGTIGIKFKQRELEELLNNLSTIIG